MKVGSVSNSEKTNKFIDKIIFGVVTALAVMSTSVNVAFISDLLDGAIAGIFSLLNVNSIVVLLAQTIGNALMIFYLLKFAVDLYTRDFKDRKNKESNENLQTEDLKISQPSRYKLLKLTEILFSAKTYKEVFLESMGDWDHEIYEALKKDRDAKLFMINFRNTYAFLLTMWQKSPIGDLIEFVVKIAKG